MNKITAGLGAMATTLAMVGCNKSPNTDVDHTIQFTAQDAQTIVEMVENDKKIREGFGGLITQLDRNRQITKGIIDKTNNRETLVQEGVIELEKEIANLILNYGKLTPRQKNIVEAAYLGGKMSKSRKKLDTSFKTKGNEEVTLGYYVAGIKTADEHALAQSAFEAGQASVQ